MRQGATATEELARPGLVGLPRTIRACLFDLDGVLTQTARLHAEAWKEMFDAFLRSWADRRDQPFVPFDGRADYQRYVDGKPRADGVRSFLESRGIELPAGAPDDEPSLETIHGLGNRKNDLVVALIERVGVDVYEDAVRYARAARDAGLRRGVVSSSANCRDVLRAAGIDTLFEAVVDAVVAARDGLPGKPAPDTYVAAARMLGAAPRACAVFEDARAGVQAARAGGFGLVVGVDRVGHAAALRAHGADVVVADLTRLLGRR